MRRGGGKILIYNILRCNPHLLWNPKIHYINNRDCSPKRNLLGQTAS